MEINFKIWLEAYQNINKDIVTDAQEMRQKLSTFDFQTLPDLADLKREFHLLKIINRMYTDWEAIGNYLDMRKNKTDLIPKVTAAYSLWKSSLKEVLENLPAVYALDANSKTQVDVLAPARQAHGITKAAERGVFARKAFDQMLNIFKQTASMVYSLPGVTSQVDLRNYMNFVELVTQEILKTPTTDIERHYNQVIQGKDSTSSEDMEDFLQSREADVQKFIKNIRWTVQPYPIDWISSIPSSTSDSFVLKVEINDIDLRQEYVVAVHQGKVQISMTVNKKGVKTTEKVQFQGDMEQMALQTGKYIRDKQVLFKGKFQKS